MKPIVLLTMPHTGTHTLIYLLAALCKAEVYHKHLDGIGNHVLDTFIRQDMNDTVVITTTRAFSEYKESIEKRGHGDFNLYMKTLGMYLPHLSVMPHSFTFNISWARIVKTSVIELIAEEAEIEITPEAREFMKEWPRLNSRHGEEVILKPEEADFMSRAKRKRLPEYLEKYHGVIL